MPLPRSRFLYDRSIVNDVAAVLASARINATFPRDIETIDRVIRDMHDMFAEDPTFDSERFMRTCRYRYGNHVER